MLYNSFFALLTLGLTATVCKAQPSAFLSDPVTIHDVTDFYGTSRNPTQFAKATGPALLAMAKCNGDWPRQLFTRVDGTEDDWHVQLYNPVTLLPYELVRMSLSDVENADPSKEGIFTDKRWWAGGLHTALRKRWDAFKDSPEGQQYRNRIESQPDLPKVQGKNLVELSFVLAALFRREVAFTHVYKSKGESSKDYFDRFNATLAASDHTPVIRVQTEREPEPIMRFEDKETEEGAMMKSAVSWLFSEEKEDILWLDPARSYEGVSLVHLKDTSQAFNGPSWYH